MGRPSLGTAALSANQACVTVTVRGGLGAQMLAIINSRSEIFLIS
jgi:hypothetical protein